MTSDSLHPHLARLGLLVALSRIAETSVAAFTLYPDDACNGRFKEFEGLLNSDGNCTTLDSSDYYTGIRVTSLAQGCGCKF